MGRLAIPPLTRVDHHRHLSHSVEMNRRRALCTRGRARTRRRAKHAASSGPTRAPVATNRLLRVDYARNRRNPGSSPRGFCEGPCAVAPGGLPPAHEEAPSFHYVAPGIATEFRGTAR
ncbi:hypothetical protein MRX96_021202 [Rhipicephalus microplus]